MNIGTYLVYIYTGIPSAFLDSVRTRGARVLIETGDVFFGGFRFLLSGSASVSTVTSSL